MLTLIILILGASFILYTILGGADFGAGIVETLAGEKGERTISKAIAPVWEANHVWLILAVVILFTGFPSVYASLSLVLHIPLMMVLLGIIFRGTAFTFRHYDVINDNTHKYYTFLFKISSFITPFFLGVTLGAMILGRITFDQSVGFYEMFVLPWLNLFCFMMGVFAIALFGYISAVFLVGETKNDRERRRYAMFSRQLMIFTMLFGLLVFAAAELQNHHLLNEFLQSPISIIMLLLSTILCPVIWYFLNRKTNKTLYLRIAVGIQVTSILIGWFYIQYPVLIMVKGGDHFTFFNTQAPEATLQQLVIALIVGLVLIVPGFIYLFKVFKVER
ncbi:MAG: cytochrome d ubiquinol oxidase subunit II [Chitinophagaceae bacterium]|nr:cytochrome d ubiquinol oxidase subunit II [Chitinophagaceae bacterium]